MLLNICMVHSFSSHFRIKCAGNYHLAELQWHMRYWFKISLQPASCIGFNYPTGSVNFFLAQLCLVKQLYFKFSPCTCLWHEELWINQTTKKNIGTFSLRIALNLCISSTVSCRWTFGGRPLSCINALHAITLLTEKNVRNFSTLWTWTSLLEHTCSSKAG